MPDMLVLKRDTRSGGLRMLMEIDPSPLPPWQPGPLPEPIVSDSDSEVAWYRGRYDEVDWLADAVEAFVDDIDWFPLVMERVDWSSLRQDVERYAFEAS